MVSTDNSIFFNSIFKQKLNSNDILYNNSTIFFFNQNIFSNIFIILFLVHYSINSNLIDQRLTIIKNKFKCMIENLISMKLFKTTLSCYINPFSKLKLQFNISFKAKNSNIFEWCMKYLLFFLLYR